MASPSKNLTVWVQVPLDPKNNVEISTVCDFCWHKPKFPKNAKKPRKTGLFRAFRTKYLFCWCIMVRETGLEPVWCEPHAPQTCASASSATPAWLRSCATYILYSFFLKCQALFRKNFVYTEKSFRLPLQIPRFIGIIFSYNALGRWDFVSHTFFCCWCPGNPCGPTSRHAAGSA